MRTAGPVKAETSEKQGTGYDDDDIMAQQLLWAIYEMKISAPALDSLWPHNSLPVHEPNPNPNPNPKPQTPFQFLSHTSYPHPPLLNAFLWPAKIILNTNESELAVPEQNGRTGCGRGSIISLRAFEEYQNF